MKKLVFLSISLAVLVLDMYAQEQIILDLEIGAGPLIKNHTLYAEDIFDNPAALNNGAYLNVTGMIAAKYKQIEFCFGGSRASWNTSVTNIGDLFIDDASFNITLGYSFDFNRIRLKPFIGYQFVNTRVLLLNQPNQSTTPSQLFQSQSLTNQLYTSLNQLGVGSTIYFLLSSTASNYILSNINLGLTVQYNVPFGSLRWYKRPNNQLFTQTESFYSSSAGTNISSLYVGLSFRVTILTFK